MALIPYDPFRLFEPIWNDLDRYRNGGRENWSEWTYRVDVEETSDAVIVTAEIPGIENKEDLNIQLDEDQLTIQGEVKRGTAQEEGRVSRRSERYYGHFSRTITLPARVKTDGAHASYRNGLLELSFLKDKHPSARNIEVNFH
ncbi:Hsp20/alpha crystallin family [Acididesulfobacillus acetoxydans]|uniref:Hsp20/alpha crystallin family n=1 Tax=Acididesulfobacillus acetoxydans TaxID=1561005 RepID=A0A8S0X6J1_9FIRM|nr:Hsp20/alpha crystallin family protein [Acididesulfobacillus acetoxydans]CAA7602570.1 Hsp20/alpha crystallin family [Acididesulfobacillus acetoxydans]CEJ07284.1 Molecular chaperone (Small heat shock protein) [Acididesulfobacillus acetoxydans]